MEIVAPHAGDTWRAVYTVRFQDAVYVLHAFQKKSKTGAATPKSALISSGSGWQTRNGLPRKAELR